MRNIVFYLHIKEHLFSIPQNSSIHQHFVHSNTAKPLKSSISSTRILLCSLFVTLKSIEPFKRTIRNTYFYCFPIMLQK